jgi:hypothetical protein
LGDIAELSWNVFLFGVADVGSEGLIFLVCVWMLVVALKDTGEFHAFFGHLECSFYNIFSRVRIYKITLL